MRDWIPRHFDFSGYIMGEHPSAWGSRAELRERLGYRADERVCIVTVGGSAVGAPLIRRILQSVPIVRRMMPELRIVVVAGPRIDPRSLGRRRRASRSGPSCRISTAISRPATSRWCKAASRPAWS